MARIGHPADAQCPDCLQRLGPIDIEPEQGPTRVETRSLDVDDLAQSLKVEIERAFADSSLAKKEDIAPKPQAVEEGAWQKTLRTIDGAATVAEALAKHIRRKATPRGPEEITDCRGTSVEKVVEVLEACSARLQEFRPIGSNATDLSILGPRPFANGPTGSGYWCSFCGKSQREVQKLIAGPSVYICNECIDTCNDIVAE